MRQQKTIVLMLFGLFGKRHELTPIVNRLRRDIKRTVSNFANEKIWVNQMGVYDISPKHLSFCICVKTDFEKDRLKNDAALETVIRQLIENSNYPKDFTKFIDICYESQETVDRVSDGHWFNHFK